MPVIPKIGAEMVCEEADCPARQQAELILLGTGTFAFRPVQKEHGWEVALPGGNISGPYATRCPKHKRGNIVTASAALGSALAKAH